jgi:phosphatidylethanolamine-binding protein (PEBP) family uncharacterized protein
MRRGPSAADCVLGFRKRASRVAEFELHSTAFEHGEPIPRRHGCGGEDLSPPLSWSGVP